MLRVTNHLRPFAAAVLCAAIAGCSSGSGSGGTKSKELDTLKLVFNPMYSANDDGAHTYQLPVFIDPAALDAAGTDPVDADSVKWDIDDKYVSVEPYTDPGSVLLTTKQAGMTTIVAHATTKNGVKVRGNTTLTISQATDDEWQQGEARYNNDVTIDMSMFGPPGAGMVSIPKDASCANCHNSDSGFTVEHTPQQTAGYSDDDLIAIFTMAQKPMGATFNSPFLKMLPAQYAEMIYMAFHTWDIAPEAQKGVVWKLRSITPAPQPAIDFGRLRMMPGLQMMTNGAAGSDAPADMGAGGM